MWPATIFWLLQTSKYSMYGTQPSQPTTQDKKYFFWIFKYTPKAFTLDCIRDGTCVTSWISVNSIFPVVVVTCGQWLAVQGALQYLGRAGGVDEVVGGVPGVQQVAVRPVRRRHAAAARQHQHHLGPGRLAQYTLHFDIKYTIFKEGYYTINKHWNKFSSS